MILALALLTIPYRFEPRTYQLPLLQAMDSGCKRAVQVWHRRAGKEKTDLAGVMVKKMLERVGGYFYVFPKLVQGRKIIWDGVDKDGMRFIEHVPKQLLAGKPNDSEMKLRIKNGSWLQVIGSDHFDSTVGSNPVGMVLSEYALQDPMCWGYYRPILAENDGWAIFNFTPRGENHAYDLHELAKADPFDPVKNPSGWFDQILTVDDTKIIRPEVLAQERKEIMRLNGGSDALYLQEYYCSFTVPIQGSYYADQVSQCLRDGRIGVVPWEPKLLVDTYWDLGVNDRMAVWFAQQLGKEIRLIDYMEGSDKGLDHYIARLREKPYVYGKHVAPHDIMVRELTNGRSRWDTAASMGVRFFTAPNLPVVDGIQAVRDVFERCWFDKDKCRDGLNALKSYRKQFDERRKTYANVPYHDWSSNGADAFRYMSVSIPGAYGKPAAAMSQGNLFTRPQAAPEWMT